MKIENDNSYFNLYQNLNTYYQPQQYQQLMQQTLNASSPSSSSTSSISKLVSIKEERLDNIKIELQNSLQMQKNFRHFIDTCNENNSLDEVNKQNLIMHGQAKLNEEMEKYDQLIDEQTRIEKQLKRKKGQQKRTQQKHLDAQLQNNFSGNDEPQIQHHHHYLNDNENVNENQTGDTYDEDNFKKDKENEEYEDDENINVDEDINE